MKTISGIFKSRSEAEQAVGQLRALGLAEDHVSLLMPGTTQEQLNAEVPTTETEQPGLGSALGGTVGVAIGAAGGMQLGAAVASLFIPGVGPVIAAGIIGAALLGAGGAVAGIAAGGALEDNIAGGLPHDELFVYEDALRQGRSVVIAIAETDEQAEAARETITRAGAESLDAARDEWWVGLRDAEEEEYERQGGDFKGDESAYRHGFEASQHPKGRGRSFDEDAERLQERYGDEYAQASFRRGYLRGQHYSRARAESASS
ncbi:MAG: hypothetical protein H0X14_05475 [Acidobacteria bacterium]|nr:hypothetical protein [Acidobacteriota bacterium]